MDDPCISIVSSASDISVLSLPSEAVPLSPVADEKLSDALPISSFESVPTQDSFEDSIPEVLNSHQLISLEEELLVPSGEVIPSLSVCANIHQAQYFPFWEDVLKCSSWHKKILKEGYRLDFIDGILPGLMTSAIIVVLGWNQHSFVIH